MLGLWRIFQHWTGIDDSTGYAYSFWSGFGSDLSEFAVIGTIAIAYRRHKCAACPRLALRGTHGEVAGTHWRTCHKHTNASDHSRLSDEHAEKHPEMHDHLGAR